jgi:GTP-binding protein
MNYESHFPRYEPYKGEIFGRQRGSIVAWEDGEAVTYGLYNAQDRGTLFIDLELRFMGYGCW